VVEERRGPVIVDFVQHLAYPPVELEDWPDGDRRARSIVEPAFRWPSAISIGHPLGTCRRTLPLDTERHYLDLAPIQETGRRFVEGRPEIYIVSNVIANGAATAASVRATSYGIRTCLMKRSRPRRASSTHSRCLPGAAIPGLSTCTAPMTLCRLRLKARLSGLRVKHDGTYNSGGYVRAGVTPTDDPRDAPGTVHPLVCTHPETRHRPARPSPPPVPADCGPILNGAPRRDTAARRR
jgi:hypothetical protein